jgi:hypothetical protein
LNNLSPLRHIRPPRNRTGRAVQWLKNPPPKVVVGAVKLEPHRFATWEIRDNSMGLAAARGVSVLYNNR